MKKLLILLSSLFIFSACAMNSDQINSDLSVMASEMSSMQTTIDDLQAQVDELTIKNEMLNAEVAKSNQTVFELETEVTYLHNEMSLAKKANHTSGLSTTPMTTVIPVNAAASSTVSTPANTSAAVSAADTGGAKVTVVDARDKNTVKTPQIVIIDETGANKQSSYDYAYELYNQRKFNDSIVKFQEFIQKYPNDDLAVNALYWIGENYYSLKNFTKAAEVFQSVITKYPNGRKTADAMLKLGYSYDSLGEVAKAKSTLNNLVNTFPSSNAASLAKKTLQKWQ